MLLVAQTNNVDDVLEENLQQRFPVFYETTNRWVIIYPIYQRLVNDDVTAFRKKLRETSDILLPSECRNKFDDGIKYT